MANENRARLLSAPARTAYARSLSELGELLKRTRTHHHWTLSRVAELTRLPERRLIQYEAGAVPMPYGHAVVLSHPLELHLTQMISVVSAPMMSLSVEEFRTLVLFARNHAKPHWSAMRKEFARAGQRFKKSWPEARFVDAMPAAWPEFLPPTLEQHLADEAAVLVVLFDDVLGPIFQSVSNPTQRMNSWKLRMLKGDNIFQKLRCGFEFAELSLHWLQQRHRACIPEFFEERVETQRERLRHAIELLAPYEAGGPAEPVCEKQRLEDFLAVCSDADQVQAGLNELAKHIRRQQ